MHFAAYKGHSAVVIELIKAGADVNATGTRDETPLHTATKTGKSCVVAVLLGAGADAKKVDSEGRKPLDVVQKGRCSRAQTGYVAAVLVPHPNLPASTLRLLKQHTFEDGKLESNVALLAPSEPVCPRT